MEHFTPISSFIGGALIGLSASLMLLLHGRIAGISGIFSSAIAPGVPREDRGWRWLFIAGLVTAGFAWFAIQPSAFAADLGRSLPTVALAGLLVGLGTRLGSGCTSGHGVCGLSRLSPRSLVATVTFILTGALTVLALGGAS